MIIDIHGHVSAPAELYQVRSVRVASRGYHGKGSPGISDERLHQGVKRHLDLLRGVGTDIQFLSPRPFQLMHSEQPESIVRWWVEANNDIIARQCRAYPDVFRGVCGLPQTATGSVQPCVEELERCVRDHDFVGCLINPDPTEGTGLMPTLDNEHWYPLYEKMVELDVPALVHSTACKHFRESYSAHFITEESIAVLNLTKSESRVFSDFPNLRIIVSHGGGSVPYQIGRWRAHRVREHESNPALEAVGHTRAAGGGRTGSGSRSRPRRWSRPTRACAASTTTRCSTTRSRSTSSSGSSAPTAACSGPRTRARAPRRTPGPASGWTT